MRGPPRPLAHRLRPAVLAVGQFSLMRLYQCGLHVSSDRGAILARAQIHQSSAREDFNIKGRPTAALDVEKRPTRARQPPLPQPGAAVLSARAGLTAEFGTGSGDPRLHGRTRAGRSRASAYAPVKVPGGSAPPWRLHGVPSSRDRLQAIADSGMGRARAISTARLRRSRALHLRPIELVVYQCPYRRGISSRRRLPA